MPRRTPEEIWATAIHEAGHAVIARAVGFPCGKTTIRARGGDASGYTIIKDPYVALDVWWRAYGKFHRSERSAMHARLLTYMAGRAAEEEILGHCTGGDDD